MKDRAFLVLLAGVLALGGALGGAFAGGMVLGTSRGEEAARSALPGQGQAGLSGLGQQDGQEQFQRLREQFQGQSGGTGTGQGFMGRGGLVGTVEKVEGDVLTISTAQGPLQARVDASTAIQVMKDGTPADLVEGLRVTVVGVPGEGGVINAVSVLATPAGAGGVLGGGLFMGGGPQGLRSP